MTKTTTVAKGKARKVSGLMNISEDSVCLYRKVLETVQNVKMKSGHWDNAIALHFQQPFKRPDLVAGSFQWAWTYQASTQVGYVAKALLHSGTMISEGSQGGIHKETRGVQSRG